MGLFYDYKKYAVIYVDDEKKSLRYFTKALEDTFHIFTASGAEEGYKLLQEHNDNIGILMTDQRMPGESGTQLLERARRINPNILRILVTAYSDLDAAIDAINTGAIYKYITKPWDIPDLKVTLMRGLEFFIIQKERDQLLQEKLSALNRMIIADRIISLSILASGMQHHVNNSLVAIKTFLSLAPEKLQEENIDLEHLQNPDFWKDFYQHAQESVDRITDLLSDLWDVSDRPKFNYKDHVLLHDLTEEVLGAYHNELKKKKIHVNSQISDQLPPLTVDKTKFRRIFQLLLKDELINLPEGAHINLTADIAHDPDLEGEHICVKINDNGPAVPIENLRSIFDPFFVRSHQPQEFGIYLIACYFMVYHHGGTMDFKSDQRQGNTFILNIPTKPPKTSTLESDRNFLHDTILNEPFWKTMISERF